MWRSSGESTNTFIFKIEFLLEDSDKKYIFDFNLHFTMKEDCV